MNTKASVLSEPAARLVWWLHAALLGRPPQRIDSMEPDALPTRALGWHGFRTCWAGGSEALAHCALRLRGCDGADDPLLQEAQLYERMAVHPLADLLHLEAQSGAGENGAFAASSHTKRSVGFISQSEAGCLVMVVETGQVPWLPGPEWEEHSLELAVPIPTDEDAVMLHPLPAMGVLRRNGHTLPFTIALDAGARLTGYLDWPLPTSPRSGPDSNGARISVRLRLRGATDGQRVQVELTQGHALHHAGRPLHRSVEVGIVPGGLSFLCRHKSAVMDADGEDETLIIGEELAAGLARGCLANAG